MLLYNCVFDTSIYILRTHSDFDLRSLTKIVINFKSQPFHAPPDKDNFFHISSEVTPVPQSILRQNNSKIEEIIRGIVTPFDEPSAEYQMIYCIFQIILPSGAVRLTDL